MLTSLSTSQLKIKIPSERRKPASLSLLLVLIFILLYTVDTFGQSRSYRLPIGTSLEQCAKGVVILKLKPGKLHAKAPGTSIETLAKQVGSLNFEKAVNDHQALYHAKTKDRFVDLSQIYKLHFNNDRDLLHIINTLLQHSDVAYAEPYFLPKPLLIPNDPEAGTSGNQNYLAIVNAYDAWEFEKGDSTIVVGILDTGADLTHEDLAENIAFNQDDPINGIDDDNDGYIDNYQGWDFANDDNDPSADFSGHGTSVAGVSSARTNNGKGIAGLGYHSKFLPIKIFDSENNSFASGYEAILYAVEQGCKVVNLSWGNAGAFSNFAQDIINKAVIDYDAVVIAAAGNTNANLNFYPASYENVLSVGASNSNDVKAGFATYSHFVDLVAPGSSEYTTKNGSTYGFSTGSSFSAPMVAGVAALVRARYPDFNARQVMEKIRLSSDDIYGIAGNETYFEQLGKGRLNAQRAVAPDNRPALRMTNLSFTNKIGPYAIGGDTINLTMDFVNYLNATSNASATISSTSTYATIINDKFEIGSLLTMDSVSNNANPFQIFLDPNTPSNTKVKFRIGFQDGTYDDFQYFEIEVNPQHIDLDNGKILVAIDSDGDLSYINNNLSIGTGFNFNGQKILDHFGIAFGASPTKIADNVIENLNSGEKEFDFTALSSLKFQTNEVFPIDIRSTFDDSFASQPIDIKVNQTILTSDNQNQNNYLVLEYRVTNLSSENLTNLFTGIYCDWDIEDYTSNKTMWDATNKLGYTFHGENQSLYAGVALLSDHDVIFNAIDLGDENGNTSDFSSILTKNDKYNLLSSSAKSEAGVVGSGNDVAQFVSGQSSNLAENQSLKISFVLAIANSLSELQSVVQEAKSLYNIHLQQPVVKQTINVCDGETAVINPENGINFRFYTNADTTNYLGEFETYTTGPINEDLSLYVVNSDEADLGDIERIMVEIKDPNANFNVSQDTVFLDENNNTAVFFTDTSQEAISWDWNFQNGFTSNSQNPSINFTEEGVYQVSLQVTTATGCVDNVQQQIVVVNRGPMPNIVDRTSCPRTPIELSADNATNLKLYADEFLQTPMQEGTSLLLENIVSDTIVYVTNIDSVYESLPKAVTINVMEIEASFSAYIDTLNLASPMSLTFLSNDNNAINWQWYFDNTSAGETKTVQRILDEAIDLNVKLIVENSSGCLDSLTQIFQINKSSTPEDQSVSFCLGEQVSFAPTGNGIYNFYEDISLQNLIHRGNTLDLGKLTDDSEIYYTGLDHYLDSDPAIVSIDIIGDFANFELPQETIFLTEGNDIQLSDLSPEVTSREWYIDENLVSTDSTFSQLFQSSGNFAIRLAVENTIGCTDTLDKNLKILVVTSLSQAPLTFDIKTYPNPASELIEVQLPTENVQKLDFKLINGQGQTIKQWTLSPTSGMHRLNIEGIKPGTYYLQPSSPEETFPTQKVIIK